ncbi:hypothetical protein RRG08_047827 [Elysia crispata]|uniref:Uncharacterized protein n=1 Tax=Elysia crispata TaxID=231223 RepID=A0AAE1B045_9GAST|nr:hypothetical protein RRG08_047827 [Elysia crispata]
MTKASASRTSPPRSSSQRFGPAAVNFDELGKDFGVTPHGHGLGGLAFDTTTQPASSVQSAEVALDIEASLEVRIADDTCWTRRKSVRYIEVVVDWYFNLSKFLLLQIVVGKSVLYLKRSNVDPLGTVFKQNQLPKEMLRSNRQVVPTGIQEIFWLEPVQVICTLAVEEVGLDHFALVNDTEENLINVLPIV